MTLLLGMLVALPLFFQGTDVAPAARPIADAGDRTSLVTVSVVRSATWRALQACMRHRAEVVGRIALGSPAASRSVPIVVQRPGRACATAAIGGHQFVVVAVEGEADFSAAAAMGPSRMNASQAGGRDDPGTVTVTLTY